MSALLLATLSLALAATPTPAAPACDEPIATWVSDVARIEAALERGDVADARVVATMIDDDWQCLSEPVPRRPLARYAHLKALLAYEDLDVDEVVRWTRAAEFIRPGAPWPAWLDESHPLRLFLDAKGEADVVTVPGHVPAHPKNGGVFFDGMFATSATGPVGTPMFVQIFGEDGAKVAAFWTDGPYLPSPWLTAEPPRTAAQAPHWWMPRDVAPTVVAWSVSGEP